jgi:hypothetical protein
MHLNLWIIPLEKISTSYNADYIRSEIKKKIRGVSVTICLIGRSTYRITWIDGEIKTSRDLGKGLLGVRLHNNGYDRFPRVYITLMLKLLIGTLRMLLMQLRSQRERLDIDNRIAGFIQPDP